MAAALTLLQLANNAGLDMGMKGAVEAMMVTDEITQVLPVETIPGNTAFSYDRITNQVTATWVAPDGTYSDAGGYARGRILAETKKLLAQPSVTPEAAARAGGVENLHGELAVSAFTAMSRKIGDAVINGSSAPTATIDPRSEVITTSNGVTATTCGGLHDLSQATQGMVKYTASGTLWRYKAPGDVDYGDAVTIAANGSGRVFSKNGENWLYITRGSGTLSNNVTSVVTIAGGANEPDGLFRMMAGVTRQWIYGGDNGGAISFELLDQLIDLIKGDGQKVLLTSKVIRRAIRKLLRDKASGETFADVGSKKVIAYDGIPIFVSDYFPTNRTRGSASGVCSAIIGMTLGARNGLTVRASTGIIDPAMQGARKIVAGPFGIDAWQLPIAQTTDAVVDRATGYVGFANELVEGVGILDGLTYA